MHHNLRCAIFKPYGSVSPNCDCGADPPPPKPNPSYDELMTTANVAMAQRDAAVYWIVMHIVANEYARESLPTVLKEPIAKELVSNPFMGWPDVETAMQDLEKTFRWVD